MVYKAIKILLVLGLILFLGTCIYFVGGVSATFPPIRTYNYNGTLSQFESAIGKLTNSDKNITYKITEKVGNIKEGYATYMTIYVQTTIRKIEYEIKYENKKENIIIGLIMAYDETHNNGGYGIKATGMNELLIIFEKEFLFKLKTKTNITLTQDKSFWTNFSIY